MPDTHDYPPCGRASALFQRVRFCPTNFAEAVVALRKTIDVAGLNVVDEIDTNSIPKAVDHGVSSAHMFIVVHPQVLARIVEADSSALLEMPLKLLVLERASGTVIIRWLDPALLFARYGNPALELVGKELGATFAAIADAAVGFLTGSALGVQSANLCSSILSQTEARGAVWL